jgi:hypothetical protein
LRQTAEHSLKTNRWSITRIQIYRLITPSGRTFIYITHGHCGLSVLSFQRNSGGSCYGKNSWRVCDDKKGAKKYHVMGRRPSSKSLREDSQHL